MMRKELTYRKSIPLNELYGYMQRWKSRAGDYVNIESIGKSSGFDLWMAKWTDPSVDDRYKEIALVTAQHSGMEISGMNAVLGVGNLLSGLSEKAREILKKQIVLMIPCCNPFSYGKQDVAYMFKNEFGKCEFASSFSYGGVKEPKHNR